MYSALGFMCLRALASASPLPSPSWKSTFAPNCLAISVVRSLLLPSTTRIGISPKVSFISVMVSPIPGSSFKAAIMSCAECWYFCF